MSEFMLQLSEMCSDPWHKQFGTGLLKYVVQGDRSVLESVRKMMRCEWDLVWFKPWEFLGPPETLSDEEKRALEASVYLGGAVGVTDWLKSQLHESPPNDDAYLAAYLAAFGTGKDARVHAASALIAAQQQGWLEDAAGHPNAAGKLLLSLSDQELVTAGTITSWCPDAVRFLLRHAPDRVRKLLSQIIISPFQQSGKRTLHVEACEVLLQHDAAHYEKEVAAAFRVEKNDDAKFVAGVALTRVNRDRYHAETCEAGRRLLHSGNWNSNAEPVCRWMIEQYQQEAVPDIASYLRKHENRYAAEPVLRLAVRELGETARPAIFAALENPTSELRLAAVEQLIAWGNSADHDLIQENVRGNFEVGDPQAVISFIGLVIRSKLPALMELLWPLLYHKSKPVQAAAARSLGRLGDESVVRTASYLEAKKASVRSAAVTLLTAAQSPTAATVLEERLDKESDDSVRDQILLALDHVWEAQGKKISREQIERRITRAAGKLTRPPVSWIDETQLPPLYFAEDGPTLKPEEVRYLLYRQSRTREMQPDVECKPLCAMLDRKSGGDFALAVLRMYLGTKMAADDRWALALAGILGDDRIVPVLMTSIRAWVDAKRGKLAEYAAQALALLGSDVALCAVDALSIRYRSKQKNIGKAASEAFAAAAERLGITVDELGDRVVPWLGFEPSGVRMIECGDKRIEARIGLDFKLQFRDLVKGKRISTLPASIPAEIRSEFKDLAATLREVHKGQLGRLENLMVRQFRWPLPRWQELFLVHPVLFPFTTRLVWGLYDEGKLQSTFRALEDHSLTNATDEAVTLPDSATSQTTIGIVHPLELSRDQRRAWAVHWTDYAVQSPFPQLERSVVRVTEAEQSTRLSANYEDAELNAMTFRGRAERLGWQRGSVCDAGGITSYRKCFPSAGVDVILELDGMFIGAGMYDSIKLGRFCFVKSGSVSVGSYVYDEPKDENDERLVCFGDVPPVVFSETMGALARIAGAQTEVDE